MEEETDSKNSDKKQTVIVKIDPSTINKKSISQPKINKVYVVPNSLSRKHILKKLNDPKAEIINASSFYESSHFVSKIRHKPNTNKVIKVSYHKEEQNLPQNGEANLLKERKSLSDQELDDTETIHISNSNKFAAEASDHETTAEANNEETDSEREDPNIYATEDEGIEEADIPQNDNLNSLNAKQASQSINGIYDRRAKDSEEHIKLAIEDVLKSNMSVKRAAHVYGIRYSVLVSKISKVGSSSRGPLGADPALTEKEELALVDWIRSRYKNGCPVKKIDLINRVSDIVSDGRPTRFKDGSPGEKWFTNFMSRNPSVATLGPTTRYDSRETPSRQTLLSWFKRCEDHLRAFGQEHLVQDPRKIGSVEELTLCLLSSKMRIITSNGSRKDILYFPQEKSGNITVLLGACADGTLTPPMPIFSCRRPPPSLINTIPSGWGIGLSKDGNINKEVLQSYFKNILIPWLSEHDRLPFLLFIDRLKVFLSVDTADFCAQKGLLIYNFYPNSDQVLQPLYKPVIEPVKKSWGALSTRKNDRDALLQFCPTLNQILFDLAPPFTIVDSFRACGIYPFDSKVPDYNKCQFIRGTKSKSFSSNDYAVALEVLEDLIGNVKTEIFQETLKGFKLLKSEDGPLFKVWHKLISKVDVSRDSSEHEEYKHERIIRGGHRKLPRPETYLMVVDDESQEESIQDYRNFNTLNQPSSSNMATESDVDPDDPNPDNPVLEIDTTESIINVFPKSEPPEHSDGEENALRVSIQSSAYWKEHYSHEDKSAGKDTGRIKELKKIERKVKRERNLGLAEQDEVVTKKLKTAIGPRLCSQCQGRKGKLIKCMVCKNHIHFDCMMEEEQQIMSDLYEDNVAFDYICPNCSQ